MDNLDVTRDDCLRLKVVLNTIFAALAAETRLLDAAETGADKKISGLDSEGIKKPGRNLRSRGIGDDAGVDSNHAVLERLGETGSTVDVLGEDV